MHNTKNPTDSQAHTPSGVLADGEGIRLQSPPPLPAYAEEPWQAQWIWLSKAQYPQHQSSEHCLFARNATGGQTIALLRKEFFVQQPGSFTVRVSGDCSYRLRLNGVVVHRGPAKVGGDFIHNGKPGHWFYSEVDLTAALRPGCNVLAVEVALRPMAMADFTNGQGGFLLDGRCTDAQGHGQAIVTDASWRAVPNEAYRSGEEYDARLEPAGWTQPGFDDSAWPFADALGAAQQSLWRLLPARIPALMETDVLPQRVEPLEGWQDRPADGLAALTQRDGAPVAVAAGGAWALRLTFQRELAGRLSLEVSGAAGTRVTMELEELPGKTHRSVTYVLREGRQHFEVQRLDAMQAIVLRVRQQDAPLVLHRVFCRFSSYPVVYGGGFACSDDALNRIWDICRWSTQICMQDYFLDSPIHQEPAACVGDYMIEALNTYCLFGDAHLALHDIRKVQYNLDDNDGRIFHTSYSLMWIDMVLDYIDHTGELALAKESLPTMRRLLERFAGYVGEHGLIERAPDYMFMDWGVLGELTLHHPPRSIGMGYLSAFYVHGLHSGARLSELAGEQELAHQYRQREAQAKDCFHRTLWDAQRGLYRDGLHLQEPVTTHDLLPQDIPEDTWSQHTSTLAVLYDIAPEDLRADLMRRLLADATLLRAQPYFLHFVFAALHKAGLFDELAFAQMRRWSRLVEEHPGSLKEIWGDGGFDCDYCHAWGATPSYQMMTRVLGVTPLEPGYRTVGIEPHFGDLQWARGTVPTPAGPVGIDWRLEDGRMTLDIALPAGVQAQVRVALTLSDGRRLHPHADACQHAQLWVADDDSVCYRLQGEQATICMTIGV